MNIERLFELAGITNNIILLESPAQLLASLKKDYPNNIQEIDDNINKARSMFKTTNEKMAKGDRLEWYIGILRAYLSNDINSVKGTYNFKDMETFNHDLFHYYGFNIGEIQNTQLTNQNISQLFDTFQKAIDTYKKSSKAPVPVQHGDYQLTPVLNGVSWWFINRSYCEEEGRSGQHCGNVMGQHDTTQRILSLRTPNHNVILTFILESNGYLGEMKAKANQKPSEKYHPNIMQLLLNPMVKGIKGAGHHPWMNFSIFDLSEQNIQVLLNHGKESFIADQIKAEPVEFLKAPDYIKNNPEYQQIAIQALPALKPLIGDEKDLKAWENAILEEVSLIIYAPPELPNFKEYVISYLKYKPEDILKAPKSVSQNFDILKEVIKYDGESIQYVMPTTPRYNELCKIAVSQDGNSLRYVPENLRTEELYKIAVSNDWGTLESVPENLRTEEICKIAVSKTGTMLQYVPEHLKTEELCKIAVSINGRALGYVPEHLRTEEICNISVSTNQYSLQYVPEHLKTEELCKLAVSKEGRVLELVPENLRTEEICKIAVSKYWGALEYVPENLRTYELCKLAVAKGKDALKFVPNHLKEKVKQELNLKESLDFKYFQNL